MATAEQFSLRWNNFQSDMSSGFHALWEGEDLVDVTLAADGRFLQAHKVVLSVCSPYFRTLFKLNPCKHPIVILKDVAYKDLKALLQFMYRGEVNVCQEDLGGFFKTAQMLEVKGLTGDDSQWSSFLSNQLQQPPVGEENTRGHSLQAGESSHGDIHSEGMQQPPVRPATAHAVDKENSNLRESSHGDIHSEGMDPAMSADGQGDTTGTQIASQVEYIKNEKGTVKLLLAGHMYTKHRVNLNGTIEWRCDLRRTCNSRIWVSANGKVSKSTAHNHTADFNRVSFAKLSASSVMSICPF